MLDMRAMHAQLSASAHANQMLRKQLQAADSSKRPVHHQPPSALRHEAHQNSGLRLNVVA